MASIDGNEEYEGTIKRLTDMAVDELRSVRGNGDAIRAACARYFKRGYSAKISTEELVDFFGVSGTVCEDAGYSETEAVEVMRLVGELTDEEIAATQI